MAKYELKHLAVIFNNKKGFNPRGSSSGGAMPVRS
jgi:hypothetical protein